jgi:hypothetical protein
VPSLILEPIVRSTLNITLSSPGVRPCHPGRLTLLQILLGGLNHHSMFIHPRSRQCVPAKVKDQRLADSVIARDQIQAVPEFQRLVPEWRNSADGQAP